jgi:hypothetical protein
MNDVLYKFNFQYHAFLDILIFEKCLIQICTNVHILYNKCIRKGLAGREEHCHVM